MCGIGGIYKIGKRPIRKWQLQELACELEMRGHDATGFALMDTDGRIHVYKIAKPAWVATAQPGFHEWCDGAISDKSQILLVHTRAYTKGSPHNNENNHPLYSNPVEGVIVHNGMVRNDDELFEANAKRKVHGFQRSCQTDSDIFRAILDSHGGIDKKLIGLMGLVDGTAAVAAIHRNSPGKLLLLRDSNPLVLGATAEMLAFASTKEALHKILKPWIKLHNIPMQVHAPDLSFVPLLNETGYIIGPKGLETHDVFKCNGRHIGGYVKYGKNTNYFTRQNSARLAALSEKRHAHSLPAPHAPAVVEAVGRVTTLIEEKATLAMEAAEAADKDDVMLDPSLYEYVVCPNDKCNKHVQLSTQDRQLHSLSSLACKSCNTNLAGAPDASLSVN